MKILQFTNYAGVIEALNASKVTHAWLDQSEGSRWRVRYNIEGVDASSLVFSSKENAMSAFSQIQSAMKGQNMFKNILNDVRAFIEQHRNVIYWLALAFLVDHFFLNGKFREKLHNLVDKLLNKIEKQVNATKIS